MMFAVLLQLILVLCMMASTGASVCEPDLVDVRYGVYPAPSFAVGKILFIGLKREEGGQARVRLLDETRQTLLDIEITGGEIVMRSEIISRVERSTLQSSQGDLQFNLEVNGKQFFTDTIEGGSGLMYSYRPSVDPRDPSNCRPRPLDPSTVRYIQLSGEGTSFTKLKLCYMF